MLRTGVAVEWTSILATTLVAGMTAVTGSAPHVIRACAQRHRAANFYEEPKGQTPDFSGVFRVPDGHNSAGVGTERVSGGFGAGNRRGGERVTWA
jgi:hypothetical protein